MEGRRHSVDVPISRALIALRRVKSLRDPSTNSMSKFSSLVDNLNWETNSNNGITLGFEDGYSKDYVGELKNSSLLMEDDQLASPNSRPASPKTLGYLVENKDLTPPRLSYAEGLDARVFNRKMDYNDCVEGEGSCNEDEMPSQGAMRNRGSKKKGWRRKHDRLCRLTTGDVVSRSGSPCFSVDEMPKVASNCGLSLHGDGDGGCGMRICWSRSLKSQERNFLPDLEERPLLLTREHTDWKNDSGVSPYVETPRSLCQKFMPKSFSELVGQNMVAKSLLSAISNDRIASFYLLYGPRGTGKTSAARIFAAALNCLSPDNDKPCGLCEECVSFFSGRSRDIREVDPVRINKIEKCRSLIKSTEVPPALSRFKVYIIDECQLLRGETWTAILNRFERLPGNVVFIMITPDLDKLPHVAVSKSQRYHLQKVKDVDVANRLRKICVEEHIDFDQDALNVIAAKSQGSLRDAEMTLDQLSLLEKKITLSLVNEINGVVSDDELLDLLLLAFSSDASSTVQKARELMRSRIDPLQLVSQLANLIMDMLAGKCPDSISDFRRKLFGTDNSEADMLQLSHALKVLSQAEKQLRTSKNQGTWLIVALLQLSSTGALHDGTGGRLSVQTVDPRDGEFPIPSTSSTGESLKHRASCECENAPCAKLEMCDDVEKMDLIWIRATRICASNSLKKFLEKRGKLVSIDLSQGTAVAKLEFDSPDSVSKAEKSWKLIANALQQILGHNVELRITTPTCSSLNRRSKFKKPSFNIFNCSRRVHLRSDFSAEYGSNMSEDSDVTPKTVITRDKYVETCSSECESRNSHTCCNAKDIFKTIRNNDGNALSVGDNALNKTLPESFEPATNLPNDVTNNAYKGSVTVKHEKQSRRRQFLKSHCWKAATLPFRKAWRLTHKQSNELTLQSQPQDSKWPSKLVV